MEWLDGMFFGHMREGETERGGRCWRGEADTGSMKTLIICKLGLAVVGLVNRICTDRTTEALFRHESYMIICC